LSRELPERRRCVLAVFAGSQGEQCRAILRHFQRLGSYRNRGSTCGGRQQINGAEREKAHALDKRTHTHNNTYGRAARGAHRAGTQHLLAAILAPLHKIATIHLLWVSISCREGWKEQKSVVATSRLALFYPRARKLNSRLVLSAAGLARGGALRNLAMKIKNSIKTLRTRHRDNRVVRRRGRLYIINKTVRRYKARQG